MCVWADAKNTGKTENLKFVFLVSHRLHAILLQINENNISILNEITSDSEKVSSRYIISNVSTSIHFKGKHANKCLTNNQRTLPQLPSINKRKRMLTGNAC